MSITYEPRAGDARALVVSLGLGGLIGLAIGGAYVAGGIARDAVSKPLLAQANRVQIPQPTAAATPAASAHLAQVATGGGMNAPSSTAGQTSLRDRFSLALAITRSVVQPFHFKTVDAAAEDHSRDTQCLAQAVYYEARGESASGQAAVAQVVLNRVRHPAFPKTVCGVVFQHVGPDCQFSFACNGAMRQPLDRISWRRAMSVAERALNGAVMVQVGAATHFQAARAGSDWAGSLAKVAQIGEHIFYRFTGRAGASRMFQAEPQRSGSEIQAPAENDGARVHASFMVASASQPASPPADSKASPTLQPAADAKTSPPGLPTSASKPVDAAAKAPASPAAAGEVVSGGQPVKAVETETSKPNATAATKS